jgi:hypothetical protein
VNYTKLNPESPQRESQNFSSLIQLDKVNQPLKIVPVTLKSVPFTKIK